MPGLFDMRFRVRDPVHGFIPFTGEEKRVMATQPVRRLSGISQLGLTSLVYPGTRHSRFEHSLGVMHLAGRIAEKVGLEAKEVRRVRLAGLLHDVGHGPFSHVSEIPMALLTESKSAMPPGMPPHKLHELVAVTLLRRHTELRREIPSEADRKWIIGLLDTTKKPPTPIARQIISGPLDADKLDYLLRDSIMAGVAYGAIDLERVLDCCISFGKDEQHLALRRDGMEAAEQVLLARYLMTRQVYRHRIRRMTDVMLQRAILDAACGKDADSLLLRAYVFRSRSKRWLEAFMNADDAWLLARLSARPSHSVAGKVVARLLRRSLTKQVFECNLKQLPAAGVEARTRLVRDPALQQELEVRLAKCLHTDRDLTFVEIRSEDNPLHRSPDTPLEQDIRLVDDQGIDERLGDVQGSLSQTVKVEPEATVYVYAPLQELTEQEKKEEYRKARAAVTEEMGKWFKEPSHAP